MSHSNRLNLEKPVINRKSFLPRRHQNAQARRLCYEVLARSRSPMCNDAIGEAGLSWQPILHPFDPDAEIDVRGRNLPHWRQDGCTYFVTFRLGDSLPQSVQRLLRSDQQEWLRVSRFRRREDRAKAYQIWYSEKLEAYLAAG